MSDHTGSENMKEKLLRALKHKAVLAERSKLLQQQVEDFRSREASMTHIASELLQRQRELNYMLHRASSVLHQMQDTNLALSAEFTHIVKELPAPRDGESASSDWDETISRVNDLFRRTHELAGEMQDEIFQSAAGSPIPEPGKDIAAVSITGPVAPGPVPRVEPPVVESPRIQAPPEPITPVVEQTLVEMRDEVSPVIDAEVVEQVDTVASAEPEVVYETQTTPAPVPEIVEATIIEPRTEPEPAEESELDEQTDDIFRRLNAVEADDDQWRDDGTAIEPPRKPSLLARIFGMADED